MAFLASIPPGGSHKRLFTFNALLKQISLVNLKSKQMLGGTCYHLYKCFLEHFGTIYKLYSANPGSVRGKHNSPQCTVHAPYVHIAIDCPSHFLSHLRLTLLQRSLIKSRE